MYWLKVDISARLIARRESMLLLIAAFGFACALSVIGSVSG
jgi:hypothetical protein